MKPPRRLLLAIVLALVAVVPYAQVLHHEFVNYDDTLYVTDNPMVQAGLSPATIGWAVTATEAANWHPLTWWSHMLDVQLFGLNAGLHHLTSVLLHAVNAALLFLVLERMTGAPWCSAFVAALFALHPQNVESVAWIGQRKTVLSTFFALLALWAYTGWVHRGGPARYLLVVLGCAASLLAKPTFVTLPFVLLLFDFWPFGRLAGDRARTAGHLVLEKAPLFVMAAASCVVTFIAQRSGGAMRVPRPLEDRLANAAGSYAQYIRATLWPTDLAVLYPFPEHWPVAGVVVAAVVLVGLSVLAAGTRRRHPHLAVGWLLYLGTLVPMIGLVQVGFQARADRYAYFSVVGLFVMLTWSIPERPRLPIVRAAAAAVVLAALLGLTWVQVGYWQSSRTLFEHTLAVTPASPVAHQNLANALKEAGDVDEAIAHYQEAVRLDPRFAAALTGLGAAFAQQGKDEEATHAYEQALAIEPTFATAHADLARQLAKEGKQDEAIAHLQEALRQEPASPEFHYGLALLYTAQRKHPEAIAAYRDAIRFRPRYLEALVGLGNALVDAGQPGDAISSYQTVVKLAPGVPMARHNLAWLLLAKPDRSPDDVRQAIALLDEACRLTEHKNGRMLDTLATAHAIAGHFDKAVEIASGALEVARNGQDPALTAELERHLARFQELRAGAPPKDPNT